MDEQDPAENLNPRQRLFVEAYLTCWSATEAARRVGYAQPHSQGPRLLEHVGVAALVAERLAQAAMGADEVLARLADQARASLADFVTVDEGGGWRIDLQRAEAAGKMHLLSELGWTKHGPKVKLYSAQAALELLGRHHRLFANVEEHTGPGGGPVQVEFVNDWRSAEGETDPAALPTPGAADGPV